MNGGEERPPESEAREDEARSLLDGFAATTGVTGGVEPRRYLWTDAFAVCTWLGLGETEKALALIDQVHRVLGRHRPDDERDGWISGLSEEDGREHPTAGGLRIGKPLPERGPDDPYDRQLEWERDGQYFHYLTKWMHALERAAAVTGAARYHRWAAELATVAYERFGHGPTGTPTRLYWKMSIDLNRPVVPSMGQHDPLDGYVALSGIRDGPGGRGEALEPRLAAALDGAIDGLARITDATELGTDDPLGVGSLLTDGWLLARVTEPEQPERARILERVLEAGEASLGAVRRSRLLDLPATQRLAFRELGLALGIEAVTRLAAQVGSGPGSTGVVSAAAQWAESMAGAGHLRSAIQEFWRQPENRGAPTWADHEDINTVMLAASLAPDGCLGAWEAE
ncbi:MAG: hypothetical protein ACN0LA_07105 [Candidatus Longimicrobiales bacterium M2_2A_002]